MPADTSPLANKRAFDLKDLEEQARAMRAQAARQLEQARAAGDLNAVAEFTKQLNVTARDVASMRAESAKAVNPQASEYYASLFEDIGREEAATKLAQARLGLDDSSGSAAGIASRALMPIHGAAKAAGNTAAFLPVYDWIQKGVNYTGLPGLVGRALGVPGAERLGSGSRAVNEFERAEQALYNDATKDTAGRVGQGLAEGLGFIAGFRGPMGAVSKAGKGLIAKGGAREVAGRALGSSVGQFVAANTALQLGEAGSAALGDALFGDNEARADAAEILKSIPTSMIDSAIMGALTPVFQRFGQRATNYLLDKWGVGADVARYFKDLPWGERLKARTAQAVGGTLEFAGFANLPRVTGPDGLSITQVWGDVFSSDPELRKNGLERLITDMFTGMVQGNLRKHTMTRGEMNEASASRGIFMVPKPKLPPEAMRAVRAISSESVKEMIDKNPDDVEAFKGLIRTIKLRESLGYEPEGTTERIIEIAEPMFRQTMEAKQAEEAELRARGEQVKAAREADSKTPEEMELIFPGMGIKDEKTAGMLGMLGFMRLRGLKWSGTATGNADRLSDDMRSPGKTIEINVGGPGKSAHWVEAKISGTMPHFQGDRQGQTRLILADTQYGPAAFSERDVRRGLVRFTADEAGVRAPSYKPTAKELTAEQKALDAAKAQEALDATRKYPPGQHEDVVLGADGKTRVRQGKLPFYRKTEAEKVKTAATKVAGKLIAATAPKPAEQAPAKAKLGAGEGPRGTERRKAVVAVAVDRRKAKQDRRALNKDLHTSEKTGLPNEKALQAALRNNVATDKKVSIIDISNFKAINDTAGMDAGDKKMKEAGDLLRKLAVEAGLKERDVFHISGDEFAVHGNGRAIARLRKLAGERGLLGTTDVGGVKHENRLIVGDSDASLVEAKKKIGKAKDAYKARAKELGLGVFRQATTTQPSGEQKVPQTAPEPAKTEQAPAKEKPAYVPPASQKLAQRNAADAAARAEILGASETAPTNRGTLYADLARVRAGKIFDAEKGYWRKATEADLAAAEAAAASETATEMQKNRLALLKRMAEANLLSKTKSPKADPAKPSLPSEKSAGKQPSGQSDPTDPVKWLDDTIERLSNEIPQIAAKNEALKKEGGVYKTAEEEQWMMEDLEAAKRLRAALVKKANKSLREAREYPQQELSPTFSIPGMGTPISLKLYDGTTVTGRVLTSPLRFTAEELGNNTRPEDRFRRIKIITDNGIVRVRVGDIRELGTDAKHTANETQVMTEEQFVKQVAPPQITPDDENARKLVSSSPLAERTQVIGAIASGTATPEHYKREAQIRLSRWERGLQDSSDYSAEAEAWLYDDRVGRVNPHVLTRSEMTGTSREIKAYDEIIKQSEHLRKIHYPGVVDKDGKEVIGAETPKRRTPEELLKIANDETRSAEDRADARLRYEAWKFWDTRSLVARKKEVDAKNPMSEIHNQGIGILAGDVDGMISGDGSELIARDRANRGVYYVVTKRPSDGAIIKRPMEPSEVADLRKKFPAFADQIAADEALAKDARVRKATQEEYGKWLADNGWVPNGEELPDRFVQLQQEVLDFTNGKADLPPGEVYDAARKWLAENPRPDVKNPAYSKWLEGLTALKERGATRAEAAEWVKQNPKPSETNPELAKWKRERDYWVGIGADADTFASAILNRAKGDRGTAKIYRTSGEVEKIDQSDEARAQEVDTQKGLVLEAEEKRARGETEENKVQPDDMPEPAVDTSGLTPEQAGLLESAKAAKKAKQKKGGDRLAFGGDITKDVGVTDPNFDDAEFRKDSLIDFVSTKLYQMTDPVTGKFATDNDGVSLTLGSGLGGVSGKVAKGAFKLPVRAVRSVVRFSSDVSHAFVDAIGGEIKKVLFRPDQLPIANTRVGKQLWFQRWVKWARTTEAKSSPFKTETEVHSLRYLNRYEGRNSRYGEMAELALENLKDLKIPEQIELLRRYHNGDADPRMRAYQKFMDDMLDWKIEQDKMSGLKDIEEEDVSRFRGRYIPLGRFKVTEEQLLKRRDELDKQRKKLIADGRDAQKVIDSLDAIDELLSESGGHLSPTRVLIYSTPAERIGDDTWWRVNKAGYFRRRAFKTFEEAVEKGLDLSNPLDHLKQAMVDEYQYLSKRQLFLDLLNEKDLVRDATDKTAPSWFEKVDKGRTGNKLAWDILDGKLVDPFLLDQLYHEDDGIGSTARIIRGINTGLKVSRALIDPAAAMTNVVGNPMILMSHGMLLGEAHYEYARAMAQLLLAEPFMHERIQGWAKSTKYGSQRDKFLREGWITALNDVTRELSTMVGQSAEIARLRKVFKGAATMEKAVDEKSIISTVQRAIDSLGEKGVRLYRLFDAGARAALYTHLTETKKMSHDQAVDVVNESFDVHHLKKNLRHLRDGVFRTGIGASSFISFPLAMARASGRILAGSPAMLAQVAALSMAVRYAVAQMMGMDKEEVDEHIEASIPVTGNPLLDDMARAIAFPIPTHAGLKVLNPTRYMPHDSMMDIVPMVRPAIYGGRDDRGQDAMDSLYGYLGRSVLSGPYIAWAANRDFYTGAPVREKYDDSFLKYLVKTGNVPIPVQLPILGSLIQPFNMLVRKEADIAKANAEDKPRYITRIRGITADENGLPRAKEATASRYSPQMALLRAFGIRLEDPNEAQRIIDAALAYDKDKLKRVGGIFRAKPDIGDPGRGMARELAKDAEALKRYMRGLQLHAATTDLRSSDQDESAEIVKVIQQLASTKSELQSVLRTLSQWGDVDKVHQIVTALNAYQIMPRNEERLPSIPSRGILTRRFS